MNRNGNGRGEGYEDDSLLELEGDQHSLLQSQVVQRSDRDKHFMEMEGRGYSDLYRNSSEEIFLKSVMENSAAPTMEMLGFKNITQSFRVDSEELFNSWLTTGENNGQNSTGIAHRTRQASRRMSTELTTLSNQQQVVPHQKKTNNDVPFAQNLSMVDEQSADQHESSMRNVVEKGMQATNLYLAKAWFHSSQPMTRSRSSELRKRYAAMQNFQTSIGMEAMQERSVHGNDRMKQDFGNTSKFCDVSMSENHNQLETFMSPSNSSTSPFGTPLPTVDSISSVVSMLKGTLERKKLGNQMDKEAVQGSSFGFYGCQDLPPYTSPGQIPTNSMFEPLGTFQAISPIQMKDSGTSQMANEVGDIDMDGFVAPANPSQMGAVSQEPSQSESSAAVISTGFEVCDGPTNSGQTLSVCESSRKQVGNGSLEYGSKAKDFRDRILENKSKDDRKKGGLARMGSVTSGGSVEKADPTKKRRVERSRKMAEAKERNLTPAVSSDMQALLKRCENLEKEVRSLKLNLSFMNRKDSEQTKQIEELQKQNEELADEKERLLEEIERILAETGKM